MTGTNVELSQWSARWNIPAQCFAELLSALADNDYSPDVRDPATLASEARVQSQVRLEAAKQGVWLTRNNVGVLPNPDTGRPVRYGLANESPAQNKAVKSADLIGFRKRLIVATDVGSHIAQFVSRECKKEGWTFKGTPRELAQQRWRDFINTNGGDAAFVSGPGSFNY